MGVPAVKGFYQGSAGQKSKSPLFGIFPGVGPRLQMTSVLQAYYPQFGNDGQLERS